MGRQARHFERSHPWLTFSLDTARMPPTSWLLLGEAKSKIEHLSGAPLRPGVAQRLHTMYLAKGVQATTAIEGNSLSVEDVEKHIRGELRLPPSKEYLQQEIENVLEACNAIWSRYPGKVTPELLCRFNAAVLKDLPLKDDVVPGEVRRHEVGVGAYRGAPAEDCPYLLERLCDWLNGTQFQAADEEHRVPIAILQAAMAHLYIAWIHPFGDGNGRTARLLEFLILVGAGVPSPAAHLLSNHYNETRSAYYLELQRASDSGGDVIPFLCYAVRGFVDGLRAQLSLVHGQHLDIVWRNYVHESFRDKTTDAWQRRRRLALDLSLPEHAGGVLKRNLRTVSPRVALAYGDKGTKALTRDVNALLEMGMILKRDGRFFANVGVVAAFMPITRDVIEERLETSAVE